MSDIITVVNMIPNLLSGETNQDSEPNLAVNPANPLEMAATAFTPSANSGSPNSPVFYSNDGGNTWSLLDLIAGTPVRDQTLRFASTGGTLYASVLWGTGGIISTINFDILRTTNFTGLVQMTVLANRTNDDQPFIQAATVPSGPSAGKDRVYVGSNDHAPANTPSTMDQSLDAGAAAPVFGTFRLEARAVSRDGFQTRPAIHSNGTVYAVFYAWVGGAGSSDVVVVRDDDWGSGGSPFNALVDTGDGKQGVRIVTGVNNPGLSLNLGQQRIGGDLSIAVDPRNSATVYVVWGDLQAGTYTLHVRKSADSGATWGADVRTILNATNPALAVNDEGRVGLVYQQVTGSVPNQRWTTCIELTHNDFASVTTHYLADTPADTPSKSFDPYLGDYLYMMAVGSTFYGIFCANNTPDKANFPNGVSFQRNANFTTHTLLANDDVTPVGVSIDPYFFKVLTRYGRIVTAIADSGNFGHVCVGSFADEMLTINNSGTGPLHIFKITAAPGTDFLVPSVVSYPIKVGAGDSVDVMIRFQPVSHGLKVATITILSDDPGGAHHVSVSGDAPAPRISLAIANSGNFGRVCVGSFADEPLLLMNSGRCRLTVTGISTAGAFLVPTVLSYPVVIGAGDSLALPIRFEPTSIGPKAGTVTVASDDPTGPHTLSLHGDAPSGKLAISGSLCFGGVRACCTEERTLVLCNVGDCKLDITNVAFKRKSRYWKLVHSPFPAVLHPGSCLPLVIRYKAGERCPRACELVISSNDPTDPVKTLELLAYTIWEECSCKACCPDCRKGGCTRDHGPCRCGKCAEDCCEDGDGDDADED